MPDFANATHGFHHTVDSALAALDALDVSPTRVTLHMDGLGYPTRWIVSQSPPAGAELASGVTIFLAIAGTGMFHALPVGMWDKGGDEHAGTQELIELFDDPFQKLAHWLREGAHLFDFLPDNPDACRRWISLFGLNPEQWPPEMWYKLSILLPNIQGLAGKEYGLRFALQLLLDLPLFEIRRSPKFRYLTESDLSLLGADYCRLGVDLVVGDHAPDISRLTLVIGQVSLGTYYEFQQESGRKLLESALALLTPIYQTYTVRWIVLDRTKQPHLGDRTKNGVLGVNSYLGPGSENANVYPARSSAVGRQ